MELGVVQYLLTPSTRNPEASLTLYICLSGDDQTELYLKLKKWYLGSFGFSTPSIPSSPPPSSTKERRELRSIFMFLKLGNTELIETNYLSAVTGWKPTQGFSSTTVFMYSKSCWLHSWADSTAPSVREWVTNWSGKLLRENHLENPLSVALFSDYRCIWY